MTRRSRNNMGSKIQGNYRRGRRRRRQNTTPTKIDNFKVDTFDFRFEGGVIRVVRGTSDRVAHYMKRFVPNRNNLVAAGISTYLERPLTTIIYLKGDIGPGLDFGKFIPKSILDEAFRTASFYQGVPVHFTWAHLISWMEHGIKLSLVDDTNISQTLVRSFLKSLTNMVFKSGYVRGVNDYRTNTLLLISPDTSTTRQIYAWDNLNFSSLPGKTEKPICNAVFSNNVLLQAEVGGHFIYTLSVDEIQGYLNRVTAKPNWIKSQKFNSIQDISVVPMDTDLNTLVITLNKGDTDSRYQLVTIGFENGVPTIIPSIDFQVPMDFLKKGLDRIVRVTPLGITTVGHDDKVGFLPLNTLPPVLSEPLSKVLAPTVETTPPSVM